MTFRPLICAAAAGALVCLAGCARVSQQTEERRPFFQVEYQRQTHGRKTLFDRIVEFDPGGMHVKVAPDYQRDAPLKIAVLPFTDDGNANFVVNKIPLTFRDKRQRAIWAWTDAQRLRRSMVGYLSRREFEVLNPIAVDVVLKSHGITDEAMLNRIDPRILGRWLGVDAVVYGQVLNYEAYYLALVAAWQVSMQGRMVSTANDEVLVSFAGSRYSVNVLPALTPLDIAINSGESLLQLRDVVLARSEEEVCREIVLRIPVSEKLRLEIARQALERDVKAEEAIRAAHGPASGVTLVRDPPSKARP